MIALLGAAGRLLLLFGAGIILTLVQAIVVAALDISLSCKGVAAPAMDVAVPELDAFDLKWFGVVLWRLFVGQFLWWNKSILFLPFGFLVG